MAHGPRHVRACPECRCVVVGIREQTQVYISQPGRQCEKTKAKDDVMDIDLLALLLLAFLWLGGGGRAVESPDTQRTSFNGFRRRRVDLHD